MNHRPNQAGPPAPASPLAPLPVFDYRGQMVADSRDVAPFAEKDHKHLLRDIRRYVKAIENSTGPKLDPLNYFIEATYIDEKGEARPNFYCTEMGCEMIAHKMQGEKGMVFTALYVQAFHAMREELTRRKVLRLEGKPKRRSLTDAIRDSGENERMKGHAYSTYTNLTFKLATGKNAAQLRKERGAAKNAHAVDFLTAAELEVYQRKESAIAVLLDAGLTYDGIKAALKGANQ